MRCRSSSAVDHQSLGETLDTALSQFRLLNAEQELLRNTLSGAVASLTDVLAMVAPAASRRTGRVVELVEHLGSAVGLGDDWQLRLAALLSGIGYAAVPDRVLERALTGGALDADEQAMVDRHPQVTESLLGSIPGWRA
jgi:HD-GYP domain-containing protein (c-di-GMP phosphodiesterase class II)